MKIYGRYQKEGTFYSIAADIDNNSYVVIDVDVAYIKTFDGSSVENCEKCFIEAHSATFSFQILLNGKEYLSPQKAKDVIKRLAEKDYIDLDEYQMCLYEALDVSKRAITITNELDEDYNEIPLA